MPPTPDPSTLQNPPPFRPHPLLQLRAGKVKKVFGKAIESAIYKIPLSGTVTITPLGIPSDEHAFEQHGGVDKALLHYSSRHYSAWKNELPGSAHLFSVGAFGENLYSEEIDEMTVCIGDRISIGEVLVEVSEPRAPCYKLNHRFEVKDMAKRAQTLFRVGWMYRIITAGEVKPGDMITLVERPYPTWTVARIMYYLYHVKDDVERMKEIVDLSLLGFATKGIFQARLDKGVAENQDGRMFGDEAMDAWNEFQLVEKRRETSQVTAFVFEALDEPKEIVPVEPGSHVRLKLGGKLVRAYSVVGGTSKRFELGIALAEQSRGGSKFLHEQTQRGDVLTVGKITASFPLAQDADHHIIIAGGIGITSFLAALQHLQESGKSYELHFAVAEEVPFKKHIAALGANAIVYNKSRGQRLDISDIVSRAGSNTHLYCCGPQRLMDGVEAAAKQCGVPDSAVHFEQFAVTTSGDPFTAELRESKKTIEVGGTQSLLDALRAVGMEVDSSCEVGNCGSCRVNVCGGRVEHKGTGLMESEKEGMMLSCVSRGVGHVVLEL
ncbi:3-chlorobenzoate-3,4-dioxygenase reductase subunit [Melanomma pulvis-pyrius CBS 109.77]|uniref:3-chlorobenzoate-3,4-dioxygenase reductase subunit n=1 Tax=Melanomma pulvis-pyrius CBS 109.77 TaxID=1314802 RepID=A0A6A6WSH0_9PLEO|nr:3-chlorobenzoate-3,4-dioxygenase reductase subunit [Melanomma pulvis-pyrius CBS 109.77]